MTFIGDGATESYRAMCNASPHGPDIEIGKEECVGHVQKHFGTNLCAH